MPKRLHLDRVEVFLVIGLLTLGFGLVFTLGVLVGYGLGPGAAGGKGATLSHATQAAVEAHGETHAEEAHRAPASAEAHGDQGGRLRNAFHDAKQQALNDLSTRDTRDASDSRPKSIADAEAHFESSKTGQREPASHTPEIPKVERKVASHSIPHEVAPAVSRLFERKPASLGFAPRPGSYTVQVASYATEDESQARVANLRKAGYNDAYYEVSPLKTGEKWYRVGIGSYPSPDWARKTGEKILHRGLAKDYVVRIVK